MTDPAGPLGETTIAEVLAAHSRRTPDRRAVTMLDRGERESESLTFAQLDARARVVAHALLSHGLRGERVVLAYPTCVEFVAALFGCFYAGAIAVPSPMPRRGHAEARFAGILHDASAAAVLSLRRLFGDDAGHDGGLASTAPGVLHIATDECVADDDTALIDPPWRGDLAMLQYTSGSTGDPRGVKVTHANIIHNQRVISDAISSNATDVVVSWLPLHHDMGLIGAVLQMVYVGGAVVLLPPLAFLQRPMRWPQAISRYRATISLAPSFGFGLCAQRRTTPAVGLDLSSWRIAICGGETVRVEMLERFADAFGDAGFDRRSFLPCYGLAECTLMATAPQARVGVQMCDVRRTTLGRNGTYEGRRLVNCGHVREGLRLLIVDPESARPVPPGAIGEVWLQGASVSAGYWNRPDQTRATFEARPADGDGAGSWLRTGDLGFLTPDGLILTGRAKDIIIVRGVNLDPLDLETVAGASHPALALGGGAAFAIEQCDSEAVVLVHEVDRSALRTLDADEVLSKIVEAISRYFGISLFDVVLTQPASLPRTTSGKLKRHRCKAEYVGGGLATLRAGESRALDRYRARGRLDP